MKKHLDNLTERLQELEKKQKYGQGRLSLLKDQYQSKNKELDQLLVKLKTWAMVQTLFAEASRFAREQLKTKIENTVTAALNSIIGDADLRFKISINTKGGLPAATWKIVSQYQDKLVDEAPETARGGGISDIVSIALRLSLLELVQPANQGLLAADEPGRNVSQEYGEDLAQFLSEYSRKTARQILMSSHRQEQIRAAEKEYRIKRDNQGTGWLEQI